MEMVWVRWGGGGPAPTYLTQGRLRKMLLKKSGEGQEQEKNDSHPKVRREGDPIEFRPKGARKPVQTERRHKSVSWGKGQKKKEDLGPMCT